VIGKKCPTNKKDLKKFKTDFAKAVALSGGVTVDRVPIKNIVCKNVPGQNKATVTYLVLPSLKVVLNGPFLAHFLVIQQLQDPTLFGARNIFKTLAKFGISQADNQIRFEGGPLKAILYELCYNTPLKWAPAAGKAACKKPKSSRKSKVTLTFKSKAKDIVYAVKIAPAAPPKNPKPTGTVYIFDADGTFLSALTFTNTTVAKPWTVKLPKTSGLHKVLVNYYGDKIFGPSTVTVGVCTNTKPKGCKGAKKVICCQKSGLHKCLPKNTNPKNC
jgi:hypothetical protein